MSDVTRILSAIEQGDPQAAQQLLPLVYEELRRLATQRMAQENPGQTLQATALVHEAYLRLVGGDNAQHWNSRGHFYMAAAEAMRRILIESARRKRRLRHGGVHHQVPLADIDVPLPAPPDELLDLSDALERLADEDSEAAGLVKLRYFAGLTMAQAANSLDIPLRTAERTWAYARTWLHREMSRGEASRPT
jgi:RNA polymerase sigma factor (TIGR02999 family)